jgi:hypothetical protein
MNLNCLPWQLPIYFLQVHNPRKGQWLERYPTEALLILERGGCFGGPQHDNGLQLSFKTHSFSSEQAGEDEPVVQFVGLVVASIVGQAGFQLEAAALGQGECCGHCEGNIPGAAVSRPTL